MTIRTEAWSNHVSTTRSSGLPKPKPEREEVEQANRYLDTLRSDYQENRSVKKSP